MNLDDYAYQIQNILRSTANVPSAEVCILAKEQFDATVFRLVVLVRLSDERIR